jgi:hypothetical protein
LICAFDAKVQAARNIAAGGGSPTRRLSEDQA